MRRIAIVVGGFKGEVSKLQPLLPDNYKAKIIERGPSLNGSPVIIIDGEDVAGWTMDDYVIPRLASALVFVQEVY